MSILIGPDDSDSNADDNGDDDSDSNADNSDDDC